MGTARRATAFGILTAACVAASAGAVAAQGGIQGEAADSNALAPAAGRLLPEVRYLRSALADPVAPRMSVALMQTSLLATQGPERPPFDTDGDASREVVAAVGVGAIFPLLQLARWDGGGAILVVDGRIFARFRVELPGRDDMGQDWYVGGAVEAGHQRWSGRVAVVHRSSHLGDEFVEATAAERIEFGGEELEVRVAYDVPGVARVYAGGSHIFRSYLRWDARLRALDVYDRALVQIGLDREWQPWQDRRYVVFGGAEYFSAERTDWHPAFSAAAGVAIRTNRALRLTIRAFDGLSHMGEFFLTPERYVSLEVSAQF